MVCPPKHLCLRVAGGDQQPMLSHPSLLGTDNNFAGFYAIVGPGGGEREPPSVPWALRLTVLPYAALFPPLPANQLSVGCEPAYTWGGKAGASLILVFLVRIPTASSPGEESPIRNPAARWTEDVFLFENGNVCFA